MGLASYILTHTASFSTRVFRIAVQRFGLGSVMLALVAVAAAIYSWRQRPQPDARRRRRLPPRIDSGASVEGAGQSSLASAEGSNNTSPGGTRSASQPSPSSSRAHTSGSSTRKPQWLTSVRRVSIGAVCSQAQTCNLFSIDTSSTSTDGDDHRSEGEGNEASSSNETNKRVPTVLVRPDALPGLKKFAALFEVYFVIRVDSDAMEKAVTAALSKARLFKDGLLDRRKIVFCETDTGRISVARQLESQLHIDETFDVIAGLQRFVNCVAFVSSEARSFPAEMLGRNVVSYTSLSGFFSRS